MTTQALPRWADLVVLPVVNLAVALLVAGAMVWLVGQNPLEVITVLVHGAFGTTRGLSYTLYYATTFVFTGLAVAVAFHGGLFNIGGEGQAILRGLGTGLVALWFSASLPAWVMLPLMLLVGALFGMVWAAIPAVVTRSSGRSNRTMGSTSVGTAASIALQKSSSGDTSIRRTCRRNAAGPPLAPLGFAPGVFAPVVAFAISIPMFGPKMDPETAPVRGPPLCRLRQAGPQ